jgi:uncharacterized protein (DUF302 family)
MRTTTVPVSHVRVQATKGFLEVVAGLQGQVGRFDPAVLGSRSVDPKEVEQRIGAMAGPSGFMLFGTFDHGALLSLSGKPARAVQYVVGNPLFAAQMTRYNIAAGLYAPLRLLIYEDEEGQTCLEYDRPSSLFGQFQDEGITAVAQMLDRKLEEMIAAATG